MVGQQERFKNVRGVLAYAPPGGSGLWRAARLSGCARHRAAVVAGVAVDQVASEVFGAPVVVGQSPFAHARGRVVERQLHANEGARLRSTLAKAGVAAASLELVQVRGADPVGQTQALLAESVPRIVVEPAVRLEVAGVGLTVRPDAVAVPGPRAKNPDPIVVEVKSFRDRAGATDPAKVEGALGQLTAGREALARSLQGDRAVSGDGVLVLPGPGAGLRAHRVGLGRWRRGLSLLWPLLAQSVRRVAAIESAGGSLADGEVWRGLPRRWSASCPSLCALAPVCRAELLAEGRVEAAGVDVAAAVGTAAVAEVAAWAEGLAVPIDPRRRAAATSARLVGQSHEASGFATDALGVDR